MMSDFINVGKNLYRNGKRGTFYALVRHRGKLHKRSLRTKDSTLARARLREFEGKVSRIASGGSKIRFEEFADQWLAHIKPTQKDSSYRRRKTALVGLTPFFK